MLGYIISDKENINVVECEIQSFDVLRKTDLNIFVIENDKVLYKNDIINNALKMGHVQVLKWFKHSGYEFKYNVWAIRNASVCGHVQVLEWFKHLGYKFKYVECAINNASHFEHIHVLEWFKHSGYEFEYNINAINGASGNGHVKVLEWFKHLGYKLKYNNYTIMYAKNIIILKWFIKNINPKKVIKWSKQAIVETLEFKAKKRYFKGYKKN